MFQWKTKNLWFHLLTGAVVLWCVVLPFFWAHNIVQIAHAANADIGYWFVLGIFAPELATGAIVLLCLPWIYSLHRLAVYGLILGAALAPILKEMLGSPTYTWPMTVCLLLYLAWRVNVLSKRLKTVAVSSSPGS